MKAHESPGDHTDLLAQQIAYYRARAGEYDEWFLRQGRYDHGAQENARWFTEVAEVEQALAAFCQQHPGTSALELAGGTGLWTEHLLRTTPSLAHLTVVDSAPETLAINRERIARLAQVGDDTAQRVEYIEGDLFAWRPAPSEKYDLVFFGFWLSHVPPERFDAFWALVRDCLAPDGRVFFVDSRYAAQSTARNHQLEGAGATTLTRRLNDGKTYRIVKVFYTPDELTERLSALGWRIAVHATPTYFLYGEGSAAGV
ncbi:MAG: class I SAM-dependent methyltransferase [Ktedonobacterales bacterium]